MNRQVFVLMVHIPDQSGSDWMHEADPELAVALCAGARDTKERMMPIPFGGCHLLLMAAGG